MKREKKIAIILIVLLACLYSINTYLPSYGEIDMKIIVSLGWVGLILWFYFRNPKLAIKERASVKRQAALDAFNMATTTIILYICGGILIGFGKSPVSHSVKGMIYNLFCVTALLVGRESIRSYTLSSFKRKQMKGIILLISLFFTLTELNISRLADFKSMQEVVITLTEYVAPVFFKNLLATVLSLYGGAKASLVYLGMLAGFEWFSPILPNLPWLGTGMIGIVIPIIGILIVTEKHHQLTGRITRHQAKKESVFNYMVPACFIVAVVWFMVGVFPYYPSAIATGSMIPMIRPGDVVVVNKLTTQEAMETLKVGDVIQFERDGLLINHRIIEIVNKDGEISFGTKGDNNNIADEALVRTKDIRGRIIQVVPKLGWPSVWIHTAGEQDLNQ